MAANELAATLPLFVPKGDGFIGGAPNGDGVGPGAPNDDGLLLLLLLLLNGVGAATAFVPNMGGLLDCTVTWLLPPKVELVNG